VLTPDTPGGPSRWSTKRSSEWQPLKPKYVVGVSYDHFTGGLSARYVDPEVATGEPEDA
jgi:hypothetical protein